MRFLTAISKINNFLSGFAFFPTSCTEYRLCVIPFNGGQRRKRKLRSGRGRTRNSPFQKQLQSLGKSWVSALVQSKPFKTGEDLCSVKYTVNTLSMRACVRSYAPVGSYHKHFTMNIPLYLWVIVFRWMRGTQRSCTEAGVAACQSGPTYKVFISLTSAHSHALKFSHTFPPNTPFSISKTNKYKWTYFIFKMRLLWACFFTSQKCILRVRPS